MLIKNLRYWNRDDCIEWLLSHDPSGVYADDDCRANGLHPMTHADAMLRCVQLGAADNTRIDELSAACASMSLACFGYASVEFDPIRAVEFIRSLKEANIRLLGENHIIHQNKED